jgi:hypothetical protein
LGNAAVPKEPAAQPPAVPKEAAAEPRRTGRKNKVRKMATDRKKNVFDKPCPALELHFKHFSL